MLALQLNDILCAMIQVSHVSTHRQLWFIWSQTRSHTTLEVNTIAFVSLQIRVLCRIQSVQTYNITYEAIVQYKLVNG